MRQSRALLNQSSTFDLVDHSILIKRLHNRYWILGSALAWFRSYLLGIVMDVRRKVAVVGAQGTARPIHGSRKTPHATTTWGQKWDRRQLRFHSFTSDFIVAIVLRIRRISLYQCNRNSSHGIKGSRTVFVQCKLSSC